MCYLDLPTQSITQYSNLHKIITHYFNLQSFKNYHNLNNPLRIAWICTIFQELSQLVEFFMYYLNSNNLLWLISTYTVPFALP